MKLLSPNEHNERVKNMSKFDTGIECPNCGSHMQYETPGQYMSVNPPRSNIKCFGCYYKTVIYERNT
jgi:ribosomal protein S27E